MRLIVDDLIGKPFDELKCWELVVEIYARAGIALRHYSYYLTEEKTPWKEVLEPESGAVLVFCLNGRDCSHVGVYIGAGKFVHSTEYAGVCVEDLHRYRNRLKNILIYGGGSYDKFNSHSESV